MSAIMKCDNEEKKGFVVIDVISVAVMPAERYLKGKKEEERRFLKYGKADGKEKKDKTKRLEIKKKKWMNRNKVNIVGFYMNY